MNEPAWLIEGWEHIWLPYAQMQTAPLPEAVREVQGSRIILEDGRELIDGVASWWSACHGYRHLHVMQAVQGQLHTLPHVMFGGLAHAPAYMLAKRLSAIAPGNLSRVFFSDSGSTATEVAMKMALQYWLNTGKPNKNKFICFRRGYHGDTLGAMAVSDPESDFHRMFKGNIAHHYVLDIPSDEYSLTELRETIAAIANNTAALIIEPLVQGAGGMRFHSPEMLAAIHACCHEHGILFIADEVATGFGRTGYMFACEEAGIAPDILCLGKALTAGTLGMAATLATETIFSAFLGTPDKAFMHGPTFMANALGCAAANASLDVFEQEKTLLKVESIEQALREGLSPCRAYNHVVDVRVKGAIGVVQLEQTRMDTVGLKRRFIEKGVWVRPFEDIVYLAPALNILTEDLKLLTQAVNEVISEWSSEQE